MLLNLRADLNKLSQNDIACVFGFCLIDSIMHWVALIESKFYWDAFNSGI